MSGTRVGVAFMVAGAVLIVIGSLDVGGRTDVIHTLATSLIVFGAVVVSVATEGRDQAAD
ncbi:hypothetical protein PO878_18255 [Iamia majanohamensis]|jgi:hypothetical protein|uniref:Uncharacterized protein n=1 Tax=Iamia majanohamensis TaxID=467976 RepID=A0AAF0BVJ5_9ACTN|nr:hypothetical protein [Iamia majanohamensis]WCO66444.1 hypothetical protein PO878_18255 [Iamia majanohamensis]